MAGEKQNRRCTAWAHGYLTAKRKLRKQQVRQDVFNELIDWINVVTYESNAPYSGTELCTRFACKEDMINSLKEHLNVKRFLDK